MTSDPFPLQGVKLSFLDTFISQSGGRHKLQSLTTTQVVQKYIKAKHPSTSLVSSLPADLTGTAQWFISHAWGYEFLDTVDAIKEYFKDKDDVVIWVDVFCWGQGEADEKGVGWFSNTLVGGFKEIGNVLLVLQPWNDPVALTRAWCIYELYAAAQTSSRFAITLPSHATEDFNLSLQEDPYVFYNALESINSSTSKSSKPTDQKSIHEAITSTVGYEALDRLVFALLFSWTVSTLQSQISTAKRDGNEIEQANLLYSLGRLYLDQGRQDELEPLFHECLEIRAEVLGDNHRDTLKAATSLGTVYAQQGKHDQAEKLYLEILERRKRALGPDHVDVFSSMYNLASLYSAQGKDEQAEKLYLDILKWKRRVLGEEHRDTLTSIHNLANLYLAQGDYAKAEPLCIQAVEGRRRTLGPDHADTLESVTCLAGVYNDRGDYDKAEPLYVDCLERRRRVLGEDDATTLISLDLLAGLYRSRGEFDRAEELYKESLERRKELLGEEHPDTIVSVEQVEEVRKEKDEEGGKGAVNESEAAAVAAEKADEPSGLYRTISRQRTHSRTLSRLGKSHERKGSQWQAIIEEAGATLPETSVGTTAGGTLKREKRLSTLPRPTTKPPTFRIVNDTTPAPIALTSTSLIANCYSPTCTTSTLCYSTSCPRRFEQQVTRLLSQSSPAQLDLSLPDVGEVDTPRETTPEGSEAGSGATTPGGGEKKAEKEKKGFWKGFFGLKKKSKR
ncbi:Kinesin light chain 3 [Rhizophlyctis rosea]|nr:Kinesin light chain 3 [Rhizophlyctis rosea]